MLRTTIRPLMWLPMDSRFQCVTKTVIKILIQVLPVFKWISCTAVELILESIMQLIMLIQCWFNADSICIMQWVVGSQTLVLPCNQSNRSKRTPIELKLHLNKNFEKLENKWVIEKKWQIGRWKTKQNNSQKCWRFSNIKNFQQKYWNNPSITRESDKLKTGNQSIIRFKWENNPTFGLGLEFLRGLTYDNYLIGHWIAIGLSVLAAVSLRSLFILIEAWNL